MGAQRWKEGRRQQPCKPTLTVPCRLASYRQTVLGPPGLTWAALATQQGMVVSLQVSFAPLLNPILLYKP